MEGGEDDPWHALVQVLECRGHVEHDKIDHRQVTIKVGFTLED
jgi:flavin-binding protein dodecin